MKNLVLSEGLLKYGRVDNASICFSFLETQIIIILVWTISRIMGAN